MLDQQTFFGHLQKVEKKL